MTSINLSIRASVLAALFGAAVIVSASPLLPPPPAAGHKLVAS